MSNQSGILAAIQTITGTDRGWNGDWHALWDLQSVPDGSWNGRMLSWINSRLGITYTSLPAALQAFAVQQGFSSWQAVNTLVLGPTITLSANTIAENSALNAVIGTLAVINGTGTWTFTELTDTDGKFNVSGSNLRGGGNFDFETATFHQVTIRATNGTDTVDRTFTIFVTDVDDTAPTITSSNAISVAENSTLSHTLEANESVTWSIVGGADQAQFEVSGSTLRWSSNGTRDFETPADANTDNAYVVQVRATDGASNVTNQTITVTVTNVADSDETAPTITSSSSVNVFENSTLSHTLTADEAVTWSIVGGADQARFELSGSTLRWASNGTKDFEAPDDANTDNAYIVQVRATDAATNFTNQTITVTVQDLSEGGGTTTYINFYHVGDF